MGVIIYILILTAVYKYEERKTVEVKPLENRSDISALSYANAKQIYNAEEQG